MEDLIYKHLKVFQAIVEDKSVRKAASRLGVTGSSVSKSLKALESQLNLLLFIRNSNRLHITVEGSELYLRSKQIVDSLDELLDSVGERGKKPVGKVRIALPKYAYDLFLSDVMYDLTRAYPLIDIEMIFTEFCPTALSEGIDIGIDCGTNIQANVVAKPLTPNFEQTFFAAPRYLNEVNIPDELSDLSNHKLIRYCTYNGEDQIQKLFNNFNQFLDEKHFSSLKVNDFDALKDTILKGVGIGMLPKQSVQQEVKSKQLIPILERYSIYSEGLFVFFHQKMQNAKRVRVVVDYLTQYVIPSWEEHSSIAKAEVDLEQ